MSLGCELDKLENCPLPVNLVFSPGEGLFVMGTAAGIFLNGYFSPLPATDRSLFFLAFHETRWGSQRWEPLKMQPPGVSYSQARTHSASRRLSQLSWKFPYQFRVLALSVPGKRTSAVFHHLDPPVSQGWRFALHPPFSDGPKKSLIFCLLHVFLIVKMGVIKLRAYL